MVNILPIASGKGGVGKSSTAVNLAITLAQKGKRVILCDFDFGGANLHTLLGLKNNHAGMGNFIYKQAAELTELLQETGIENLKFIAGDCLYPGTANMDASTKRKIIRKLNSLDTDYVILDLGAGTTYNTLDFYLTTYNSILVTTPEITSVLNAYSFLKAASFRFFMQQFKARSEERLFINDYIKNSTSGTETSFIDLIEKTSQTFTQTTAEPLSELAKYRPQVIVNMGETAQDLDMAKRLRSLVQNKLGIKMDFVGFLPKDERVSYAVALRKPLALTDPQCKFVKAIETAAGRILQHSYEYNEMEMFDNGNFSDEDLNNLSAEFTE
ncbi:P-loop NTPase [Treponema sp.]|uniref:P-loop NTPase n=1 Tax=Treponema sp. TaxID=166 RepID=UPI00388E7AA7